MAPDVLNGDVLGGLQLGNRVSAYRSADVVLNASVMVFDTEELDEAGAYNPATGEWIVPQSGYYSCVWRLTAFGPDTGAQLQLDTGAGYADVAESDVAEQSPSTVVVSFAYQTVKLTAGWKLRVRQGAAVNRTYKGGRFRTHFSAFMHSNG